MYREFNFSSITPDINNHNIVVAMTAMVDNKTVTQDTIRLLDCTTNQFVNIVADVIGDRIIIDLIDPPIPNNEYHLTIKGVTDITGCSLTKGINYKIWFDTTVKTEAMLITPSFSEEINNSLVFTVREYIPDRFKSEKNTILPINSFFIEVATDNLFNNIEFSTRMINRTTMNVMDLPNGQYYARVRVQSIDGDYGMWSETTTFVLNVSTEKQDTSNNEFNIDSDEPIFYKQLSITGVPKDGDDCQSFYIQFSEDIDLEDDGSIEVYRRLI